MKFEVRQHDKLQYTIHRVAHHRSRMSLAHMNSPWKARFELGLEAFESVCDGRDMSAWPIQSQSRLAEGDTWGLEALKDAISVFHRGLCQGRLKERHV